MIQKQIFILSTGQHVGKTTTSLAVVNEMNKRVKNVAYCKPVGQQHVTIQKDNLKVDKDTFLFKDYFQLKHEYKDMSPVLFPSGFTRDYLDHKVNNKDLILKIKMAHDTLKRESDFLVCEGTGHTGVGSICEVNNAQVADVCKMDVICVALGGLGSSFDQLAMNRDMLLKHNVNLKGVILNKVNEQKMDMVKEYFTKALDRWKVPLIGCIPQLDALSKPSIADFSKLLKSEILCGFKNRLRYFSHIRLAAAPVNENNVFHPVHNQLVITHSGRHDVLNAMLMNQKEHLRFGQDLETGLVLTGWDPPSKSMIQDLDDVDIPCIYVPPSTCDSYTLTARISNFVAKLSRDDEHRLALAINHVSKHIDLSIFQAS